MAYVDGFVIPMPKSKIAAYKKLAQKASVVWIDHGALDYWECVGDDLKVKFGLPFTRLAKAKPSDTVVFAFIVYKSKADRNRVNRAVMKDKRLTCDDTKMPFDVKKMAYGGFKELVRRKK